MTTRDLAYAFGPLVLAAALFALLHFAWTGGLR